MRLSHGVLKKKMERILVDQKSNGIEWLRGLLLLAHIYKSCSLDVVWLKFWGPLFSVCILLVFRRF